MSKKKLIDDELDKNTINKFNQTLQNYLKVSVGNDTYNLINDNKVHLVDIAENKHPNKGYTLLPRWRIKNNIKVDGSKIGIFLKSTKTSSPSGDSGATSVPPIGSALM